MLYKKNIISSIFILLFPFAIKAQTFDSKFYNWEIYEIVDDDSDFKKCYTVNFPVKTDTNDTSRKKPYLMITRFQKDRIEEVSIFGGFDYKVSSHILMLIDSYQFRLKTKSDYAWAKSRYEDVQIIENLLKANKVMIRSDSAFGRYAVDEYNLKGVAKALKRVREICS